MMQGSEAKSTRLSSIEDTARRMLVDSEKMGLDSEVRDIIDTLDDCREKLTRKADEISMLEAIAMESKDDNIKELREQLFAVVKMVHSDLLAEVANEYYDREGQRSSVFIGSRSSPDVSSQPPVSKYDILERMRRYLNNRAQYKEFMQRAR